MSADLKKQTDLHPALPSGEGGWIGEGTHVKLPAGTRQPPPQQTSSSAPSRPPTLSFAAWRRGEGGTPSACPPPVRGRWGCGRAPLLAFAVIDSRARLTAELRPFPKKGAVPERGDDGSGRRRVNRRQWRGRTNVAGRPPTWPPLPLVCHAQVVTSGALRPQHLPSRRALVKLSVPSDGLRPLSDRLWLLGTPLRPMDVTCVYDLHQWYSYNYGARPRVEALQKWSIS